MKFTLFELWSHMGFAARAVAASMLVMSFASLVVVCERAVVLATSQRRSLAFARRLAELLAGGDFDRAAATPAADDIGHLGRVLQAALRVYATSPKHDPDLTFESVARALERQALREVHRLRRGIGLLASVATMAPFVGLLGTVLGIVNAFEKMAETGSGGLSTVSAGIAEALVTTALGLLVALPAMGAYNGFSAWIDARALDIAEASNELLDLLARQLRQPRGETLEPSPTALRSIQPIAGEG